MTPRRAAWARSKREVCVGNRSVTWRAISAPVAVMPMKIGPGPGADRGAGLLAQRGVRLVADDDRVGAGDVAGVAHEPLVGLDRDRPVGGVLALEQRAADAACGSRGRVSSPLNWSTRLRRWVRISTPPVREASTKPSAATVLPAPVACSNQKRLAALGSSGCSGSWASSLVVLGPVAALLLGVFLLLVLIGLVVGAPARARRRRARRPRRPRRASARATGPRSSSSSTSSSSSSIDPSGSSSSSTRRSSSASRVLRAVSALGVGRGAGSARRARGCRPRRAARARRRALPLPLPLAAAQRLGQQRGERARERVDLVGGEHRAVGQLAARRRRARAPARAAASTRGARRWREAWRRRRSRPAPRRARGGAACRAPARRRRPRPRARNARARISPRGRCRRNLEGARPRGPLEWTRP